MSRGALHKLERLLSRVQQRSASLRAARVASVPPFLSPRRSTVSLTPDLPFASAPPPTGRLSKAHVSTPLEESMELLAAVERTAATSPGALDAIGIAAPDSEDLVLDDFDAPAGPTLLPPGSMLPAAPPAPVVAPITGAVGPPVPADLQTRAPAVEARAPAVEARAPAVEARAPAVEARAPAVEARAPAPEPRKIAQVAAPAVPAVVITAPSARIATAPIAATTSPIATVSAPRTMEPKNFGELLDLSLALRTTR